MRKGQDVGMGYPAGIAGGRRAPRPLGAAVGVDQGDRMALVKEGVSAGGAGDPGADDQDMHATSIQVAAQQIGRLAVPANRWFFAAPRPTCMTRRGRHFAAAQQRAFMTARMSFPPLADPAPSGVTSAAFRRAMAHVTAAVHVITTAAGPVRAGLTASAVTSLSDSPPMMLACIRTDSHTLAQIEANGSFCVNTLSDLDQAVAEIFAGRKGLEGEVRFSAGDWRTLATGAPVLSTALNSFDCELIEARTMATHRIVIGKVVALAGRDGPGLIYRNRLFGHF
jgi:flavin reductase